MCVCVGRVVFCCSCFLFCFVFAFFCLFIFLFVCFFSFFLGGGGGGRVICLFTSFKCQKKSRNKKIHGEIQTSKLFTGYAHFGFSAPHVTK